MAAVPPWEPDELPPSGRRDSNPRPSPWQGDALPTALRPHAPTHRFPGGAIRNPSRVLRRTPIDRGRGPACRDSPAPPSADALGCRGCRRSPTYPVRDESPARIWVDGRPLRRPARAWPSSVTDHGLVVGDGVFEALKVTSAGPFALRRHLDRLEPFRGGDGPPRARPPVVLRGRSTPWLAARRFPLGEGPHHLHGRLRPPAPSPRTARRPSIVAAAPTPRPHLDAPIVGDRTLAANEHGALSGVKSTSYAENVRALAYALAREAGRRSSPTPSGTCVRAPAPTSSASSTDEIVTPPLTAGPLARHHPRPAPGVVPRHRGRPDASPRLCPGRRDLPDLFDPATSSGRALGSMIARVTNPGRR